MYVYLCKSLCICKFICVHRCVSICQYVCLCLLIVCSYVYMCIYVCVLCVYLYVCVWLHICVYVCGCMCVYTLYIYISYTYYRPVIKPFLGARSKSVNASAWVHSLSLAAFLEKHGREVQIIFGTFLEADINTPSKGSY